MVPQMDLNNLTNEGLKSTSVISYPSGNSQTDVVIINSRAESTLRVVAVEWVTESSSSKIKAQVKRLLYI